MRKAEIFMHGVAAGHLEETAAGGAYCFKYHPGYKGPPISLTMPIEEKTFEFDGFPPFFEGLLPEGMMLESLLKKRKLDRHDYFGQLVTLGADLVGAVTVVEITE
jgi:serine/threonine-protein kinase HipA